MRRTNLSKKIKIPKVDETAGQLLAKATKDKKIGITKPKKKETRGRPRKKVKPTWQPKKYREHVIANGINKFLTFLANKMVPENPLSEQECEIGEAILYTVDYYGITPDHPLVILTFATGSYIGTYFSHKSKIKKKKESVIPKERTEKVD